MLCVFHDRFYGRGGGDRSIAQSSSPCRLVKILADNLLPMKLMQPMHRTPAQEIPP